MQVKQRHEAQPTLRCGAIVLGETRIERGHLVFCRMQATAFTTSFRENAAVAWKGKSKPFTRQAECL